MPDFAKKFTLAEILGWLLMASVSVNTYFVKEELSGIRSDFKEIRKEQAEMRVAYAALNERVAYINKEVIREERPQR